MNTIKFGTNYEKYVQKIVKSKYCNVWLWSEVPNKIMTKFGWTNKNGSNCDDIGCDLIAELSDGSFHFIQCKNYSTTGNDNMINICDLSGFYNFIAENDLCKVAYVYYSGKLSSQVVSRTRLIKYINLPYVSFMSSDKIKCDPRDYQIRAYDFLKAILLKAVLAMPCGTGKTLVEYLLSLDFDTTIILSPLISTSEQTLVHFKNYYNGVKNVNFVEVNSSVGRDVKKYSFGTKNIISSTYDSCDIVNKLIVGNKFGSTLIVIDEFHNLTQNQLMDADAEIYKLMGMKLKTIFVSATPKYIEGFEYGPVFKYDRDEAIANKYICDFSFNFPNNAMIENEVKLLKLNAKFVDSIVLINKAYYLLTNLLKYGCKKTIVFLKTVSECEEFTKIIGLVNAFVKLDCLIDQITYATSKKNRGKILNRFICSSKVHILCNVHVLDEGIDIHTCDSVFVTNPTDNIINLIQRISRCNRLDPNNLSKVGHVFLWTYSDTNMKKVTQYVEQFVSVKVVKDLGNDVSDNESDSNGKGDCKPRKVVKVGKKVKSKKVKNNGVSQLYAFYCRCCGYYTEKLSSFKDHLDSKKHIINSPDIKADKSRNINEFQQNVFICTTCDDVYLSNRSLQSHIKKCCPNDGDDESDNSDSDGDCKPRKVVKVSKKVSANIVSKSVKDNEVCQLFAFYCKCCNYCTEDEWNFKLHLNSKKHTTNSPNIEADKKKYINEFKQNIFICTTCDNVYMSNRSLQSHIKKCCPPDDETKKV